MKHSLACFIVLLAFFDYNMDIEVLEEAEIEDLNQDSIRGYHNSHKSFKPDIFLSGWRTRNISGR